MENDNEERIYEEDISNRKDNVFSTEYKGQNLKNNQNYKNWKNSMFKKYGNDAKLFHCHKDNILFYVSNKECMDYPYYATRCPKCNYFVCYFCPFMEDREHAGYGKCCLKRRLYYSFYQDSQIFISPRGFWKSYDTTLNDVILVYLIPFLNLVFTIACISALLFYKMHLDGHYCYENRIKTGCVFELFFVINALFAIVLSISYILLNFYFLLIMWIISLPFKLIPIKFWAGIIERGLAG